jgi:hypothetical protein
MFKNLFKSTLSLFLLILFVACAPKTITVAPPQLVANQLNFTKPEQAVEALKQAVRDQDQQKLVMIFGPECKDLLSSGDDREDRQSLENFSRLLQQKAVLVHSKSTDIALRNQHRLVLLTGKHDWPFPIPLIAENTGWRFDTDKGKQELITRRIGKNEIYVIKLIGEYVAAQKEYYAQDRNGNNTREYASKLTSSTGKKDGLYWQPIAGEPLSPFGPLVAMAGIEDNTLPSYSSAKSYYGYFFRILKSQSKNARGGLLNYLRQGKMTEGFALIAYPAEWDSSGIMSFIVAADGVIYQKNLGPQTIQEVAKINSFDPDFSWTPIS